MAESRRLFQPPQGPRTPRAPTTQEILQDAHGRELIRRGKTAEEYGYNQFVEETLQALPRDDPMAKKIRDVRAQKQAAGLGENTRSQRLAEINAELGGESAFQDFMERANPFNGGFGRRDDQSTQELLDRDAANPGGNWARDAAKIALLGGKQYVDTLSLGASQMLSEEVVKLQGGLTGFPSVVPGMSSEDVTQALMRHRDAQGRPSLGPEGADDLMTRGVDATRDATIAGGASPTLVGFGEGAGQLLAVVGPGGLMSWVNKLGDVLKVSSAASRGLPMLGRILQNPVVNYTAVEAALSESEIQRAHLRGDTAQADQLREDQGGRLINAAVLGVAMAPLQLVGRAAERTLLRGFTSAPERAKFLTTAIKDLPNRFARFRATAAHMGGKAVEFQAFSFVPQVYRPGPDGKTELSPWVTTILNPVEIQQALEGKSDAWTKAVGEVWDNALAHAGQHALTGGLMGAIGGRGAPMGGNPNATPFRDLVKPGPRQLMDPAAQAQAERRGALQIERAAREGLTPQERKQVIEAWRTGFDSLEGGERGEAIEAVVKYVAAASQAQIDVLKRNGHLAEGVHGIKDAMGRYIEDVLGKEVFDGVTKAPDEPGLGVQVELARDPRQPGKPGRRGEILNTFEAKPGALSGRAEPDARTVRMARVRFEDGTVGVFEVNRLNTVIETPAAPPKGQGEAAAKGKGEGDLGRVRDQETGHVADLVRVHQDRETGRKLVDVQVDGEVRTYDADRWVPHQPQAPTGRAVPGKAETYTEKDLAEPPAPAAPAPRQPRELEVRERLEKGEVPVERIVDGAERMARDGGWGDNPNVADALARRFKLSEEDSLGMVEHLGRRGLLTPRAVEAHNQRLIQRYYGPPEAPKVKNGDVIGTYRAIRRSFARAEAGGNQNVRRLTGRMLYLWERMTPQQREATLRGVTRARGRDFLPHERGGEIPTGGKLPEILRRLGVGEAPQSPQEAPVAEPPASVARPEPASEAPSKAAEPAKETPPTPKQDRRGVDRGEGVRGRRYSDTEAPANETPEQRRARRLRATSAGRRRQAFEDSATGLGNKRAFEKAAVRGDRVGIADLTGLKAKNDTHGQAAGDQLIVKGAELARAAAKEAGIAPRQVFRIGGDEYAVLGSPEKVAAFNKALERMADLDTTTLKDGRTVTHRLVGAEGATLKEAGEALNVAKAKSKAKRAAKGEATTREDIEGDGPVPVEPQAPKPKAKPKQTARVDPPGEPAYKAPPEGRVAHGSKVSIRQPGSKQRVPGRYALIRVEDLLPSNDAGNGFAASKGYPQEVQPRDYLTDPREQAKVHSIVGDFDPADVLGTTPRASQGSPSVAWSESAGKFVVLNGNGRSMAMIEALKNAADRADYERVLAESLESYGLAGQDVSGKVLVRDVELAPTSKAAIEFARRGNLPDAARQRPVDRAYAESDLVPDAVLADLSRDAETTLLQAVNGPSGKAFRKDLAHRLGASGNDLFTDDLGLTEAGKEFVEFMLLKKAGFSRTDLADLTPELRRTVASSTMQVLNLKRNASTADLHSTFMDSLRFVDKQLDGGRMSVADYDAQLEGSLISGQFPAIPSMAHRAFIEGIRAYKGSPRKMRDALSRLVNPERLAEGQGTLLGDDVVAPRPAFERIAEAFDLEVSPTAVRAARENAQAEHMGFPAAYDSSRVGEWTPEQRAVMGAPDPVSVNAVGGLALPISSNPTPDWSGRIASHSQVVEAISKLFDVPIQVGRSRAFAKNALGFFNVRGRFIRLKDANNIVVTAHEAGHALEKFVFPELVANPKDPHLQARVKELVQLGYQLYGRPEPWNGYASEGFAEFMRLYLTQPNLLAKHAPRMTEWFERNFQAKDAKWKAKLLEVRQMAKDVGDQGTYNRILAQIVSGPVRKGRFWRAVDMLGQDKWIEEFHPIHQLVEIHKKLGGRALDPHEDPYQLADYFRGTASARARFMAERGMIDAAGNRTGEAPLADAAKIMETAAKKRGMKRDEGMDALRVYLIAKRAVDLHMRGKGPRHISAGEAQVEVQRLESEMPELLPAAKIVWAWNRGWLSYVHQLGALPTEHYNRMVKQGEHYIPFMRHLPDAVGGSTGIGGDTSVSPFKRIHGSGRDILDPFPQMVAHAAKFIQFAHRRAVLQRIGDLATMPKMAEGMGRYIREVDPGVVKKVKGIADFRSQIRDAGFLEGRHLDLDAMLTWYEPITRPDSKDPIIPVIQPNGKARWFEVDRQLYDSLQGMDPFRLPGGWDTFVGVPARLKRLGTTGLRAGFSLVTNPIRDYFTMLAQSQDKNIIRVTKEWARAQAESFGALFGKESHYREYWRALGGEMSQPLGQDSGYTYRLGEHLGRSRFGRVKADLKKGRVLAAAGDLMDLARDVFSIPEAGPRIAEMRLVAKKIGFKPGEPITAKQALDFAIQLKRAGAQVTVDFAAAGRYAKIINAAVPFFNVAIQGPRAYARAFQRNPMATTLISTGLTAATIALWNENKDKDWYKDLPWAEKFDYWHIEVDGQRVRIPRPFEVGVAFSAIPEAIVDSFYQKDPRATVEALGYSVRKLKPDINPVLWKEYIEQKGNLDSYRNRPIVPKAEERLPAEEQYGSETTTIARGLGSLLGWSPRRIDHAINGIFGGLGSDVTRTVGQVDPAERYWQPADFPVLGRLLAYDGAQGYSSQAVQDMFDMRQNLQTRSASKKKPATPGERAALQVLESAADMLKLLREERNERAGLDNRAELIKQMRTISQEAVQRAQEILRAELSQGARESAPAAPAGRRLFRGR